jgi:hypothetical protein
MTREHRLGERERNGIQDFYHRCQTCYLAEAGRRTQSKSYSSARVR